MEYLLHASTTLYTLLHLGLAMLEREHYYLHFMEEDFKSLNNLLKFMHLANDTVSIYT